MDPIFKKLKFKEQPVILILNAPDSFQANIKTMQGLSEIQTAIAAKASYSFVLGFVTQKAEIETLSAAVSSSLEGDALLWIAYPKKALKIIKPILVGMKAGKAWAI